ncbi:MAG: hypothetical protein U1E78_05975 [Gammaproteobacteria bacterium]
MIVRCIKIISSATGKDLGDKSPWLTVGSEYFVFALRLSIRHKGDLQYLIETDQDGELGFFSSSQFKIVSGYLPSTWKANYDVDGCFVLMPPSWFSEAFLEGMDEGTDEAMALFEKEKLLMLKEEGLIPRDS